MDVLIFHKAQVNTLYSLICINFFFYSLQVIQEGKTSHFIDASDPKESNWMRFVNCARSEEEQCVTAYQHQGEVYYRAHKDIHPGTELLVGKV